MSRSTSGRRGHSSSLIAVVVALVASACGATPSTAAPQSNTPTASVRAASAAPAPSATTAATASLVASTTPSAFALQPFGRLPTAKIAGARAAAMDAILQTVVKDGAPDVIAAVMTPAGSWSAAAGIGGPDGRTATVKDEFAIASVTKTITASLVMRLAEQGKIDLDAPLQTYLGTIKANANGATVRQVLGQRSGLADWVDAPRLIKADPAHHWTQAELLGRLPPPSTEPGIGYAQAGPNYFLLGLAIEHVTGLSLSDALRTEVL